MESDNVVKILQKLDKLDTLYSSAMDKIINKDRLMEEKDKQIKELSNKVVELLKEKDAALKAKIETLELLSKEREQFHQKEIDFLKTITDQKAKIEKLKQKKREAQDNMMGSSFAMDRLKKESEEKERQLKELEQRLASFATGETGVFYDFDTLINYLKKRIQAVSRSLRLVVPDVAFLTENGLIELLDALPDKAIVNIAASFDELENGDLITKWKEKGFYLTKYDSNNLVAIGANGADVGIAYLENGAIAGFYTIIPELTQLFNDALMHAFIKGKKI